MAFIKITPTNEKSACTAGETCDAQFSLSNTSGQPLSCGIQIKSQDNVDQWINVEGAIERKVEEGIDTTVTLKISPPKDLLNADDSPKIYAFRLRVYDVNQPEEIVDSPTVTVTVKPAKAEDSRPFPWLWMLAVIPVIAVVGVVFWLLQSPSGEKYTFVGAEQISNHPSGFGDADNAIDGDTNGQWQDNNNNTLTGTNGRSSHEWWLGDLGESQNIGRIVVYNRTDCCERWRKDFHVFVSDDKISGSSLNLESAKAQAKEHFHYLTREAADSFTWKVPAKTRGRYVMVMTTPEEKNLFNVEKAKLDKQFNDLKSEIAGVNSQINQVKREISDAEKTISDAEKRIPSIKEQIASAEKTISDSRKQLSSVNQEIQKLQAEKDKINKVISAQPSFLRDAIKATLAPQLNQLNSQLNARRSEKSTLERRIADSEKQVTTLNTEKSGLEKQISDSESRIAKIQKDQTNLQKELASHEKESAALAEKVATYDNEAKNSFLSLAEIEVFSP